MTDATIWNPKKTSIGGTHAFFIVRGDPRAYNLPANPEVPTTLLKQSWSAAAVAAGAMVAVSLAAFLWGAGGLAGEAAAQSRDSGVKAGAQSRRSAGEAAGTTQSRRRGVR